MILKRFDPLTLAFVDILDISDIYGESSPVGHSCFGISIDDVSSKVFAVDSSVSKVVRIDKVSLLGDLIFGSPGSGDANFSSPSYSAIIMYSAPAPVVYEDTLDLGQEVVMTQTFEYIRGDFDNIFLEETYKDVLQMLLDDFTPEMVRQYQESILFKSFVEALALTMAEAKLEINQSIKELNIQQATTLFLNLWAGITGLSRKNINGVAESDIEYRKRLLDSIFWDKVSNNAMKKSVLLKLGIGTVVSDRAYAVSKRTLFTNPPNFSQSSPTAKYLSNIVEISLDGQVPTNAQMTAVYNEVLSLLAVGNIIGNITRDIALEFLDVSDIFGRIPYGPIFMQAVAGSGAKSTASNWSVGESIYMDNQYGMNSGKFFSGNMIPDDIAQITYDS